MHSLVFAYRDDVLKADRSVMTRLYFLVVSKVLCTLSAFVPY
jgi:hypothetical protein